MNHDRHSGSVGQFPSQEALDAALVADALITADADKIAAAEERLDDAQHAWDEAIRVGGDSDAAEKEYDEALQALVDLEDEQMGLDYVDDAEAKGHIVPFNQPGRYTDIDQFEAAMNNGKDKKTEPEKCTAEKPCDACNKTKDPKARPCVLMCGPQLPMVSEPVKVHYHPPTEVITGDGWSVSAGKVYDCEDKANGFDIVVNLTGTSIKEEHTIPIPELTKWSNGGSTFTEVMLDWPDYGVVSFPLQFWLDLVEHIQTKKLKLLVFCVGGHGRTGTAVASFLIAALGWDGEKATKWVRESYCERAIESKKQEDYILNLSAEMTSRKEQ